MFYCPTHSTRIFETSNARFIENDETSQNVEIKEVIVQVHVVSTSSSRFVVPHIVETRNNQEEQQINDLKVNNEPTVEQPQEVVLRRVRK